VQAFFFIVCMELSRRMNWDPINLLNLAILLGELLENNKWQHKDGQWNSYTMRSHWNSNNLTKHFDTIQYFSSSQSMGDMYIYMMIFMSFNSNTTGSVFFNVYLQNTAQFADDLLHFEYIRFNKYFLEKRLKTPNGVIRSRKSKQDSQCNDAQKKTKGARKNHIQVKDTTNCIDAIIFREFSFYKWGPSAAIWRIYIMFDNKNISLTTVIEVGWSVDMEITSQ
jgi:hypothetical protein